MPVSSSEISLYFFLFLEFVYLILTLSSLFVKDKLSNLLVLSGYILAGFKFSTSAFQSIDIITYNIFYQQLGNNFDNDLSSGFESGFVYLLYAAKSMHLPLVYIHFGLVVFFLFTVNRFFTYLLPKHEANTFALIFGLFPIGGELCIYLLRQLSSTSVVILGLSFAFKSKKIVGKLVGLAIFGISLLFHVSSIVYLPFFLIVFVKKKSLKILILTISYILIITFFFLPSDIFLSSTEGMENDDYTSKYKNYSNSFDERNDPIGPFSITVVGYLVWCMLNTYQKIKDNKIFDFACSSILIFITYINTEIAGAFWMSSRIKFISTMLLMSSNIILTTNFLVKSQTKLFYSGIICFLYVFSVLFITKGHYLHGLYNIQL